MWKKTFAILLILLLPILAHKFLHKKNGHFRLSKILKNLEKEEVAPLGREALVILDQEFHYMAMGHHTYAFLSEDGKYVLKFPRYHKFRSSFWLRSSLLPQNWRQKKIDAKKDRFDFFETSHRIAWKHLREETGILYLHFGKTDFLQKEVVLCDGFGKKVRIHLDEMGFALQRYFPIYGKEFPKQTDEKTIRNMFRAYFEVIGSRYEKGIMNKDRRGWGKNYGIVYPDVAYEIDLGAFHIGTPAPFPKEIRDCSKDYGKWLARHAPDLLPIFEEEMERALAQNSALHFASRNQKIAF